MDTVMSSSTKLLAFKITGLIFLLDIGIHGQEVDFCNMDNQDITTDSSNSSEATIILLTGTNCGGYYNGSLMTISVKEKELLVKPLNELRNKIAEGTMNLEILGNIGYTLLQAASMTVLQWDDALEEAARKKIISCNFTNDVIKFGQFQAVSVFPPFSKADLNTYLKRSLHEEFLKDAQSFNVSEITAFKKGRTNVLNTGRTDSPYQYFPLLANHYTLYVGCGVASFFKDFIIMVCYFAPWEEAEHKILYKPGSPSCSDCPFKDVEYDSCDSNYNKLCKRPPWGICDHQTQNANYLEGFKKYKATTPTSNETASTTLSSTTLSSTTLSSTTLSSTTLSSTTLSSTTLSSTTLSSTTLSSTTLSSTTLSSTTLSSTTLSSTTLSSTTTTITARKTTTKSRSPKLVPSCYIPIIIFGVFLVTVCK